MLDANRIGSKGSSITFPFFKNGEVVNVKTRTPGKGFSLEKGCEITCYGYDDLAATTLICEGEIDKLSLETAGFKNSISVPNGAKSIGFLASCEHRFKGVEKFILAVDNDQPGVELEQELARRLGFHKCWRVTWPDGCKDANDVLVQFGTATLRECIENAEPYPTAAIELQWGEPVLFNHVELQDIPSSLLPELYEEYSRALSHAMEVPEAMTVTGILGVVSAVASHRFYVSPKMGWQEPVNCYFATAIDPGNLKSPTMKKLTHVLAAWESEQAEKIYPEIKQAISERKTKEKVIERLRTKASNQRDPDLLKLEIKEIADMESELQDPQILPKVFATDSTPEQLAVNTYEQGGRFAILSDEGGILKVLAGLYSGGNANIDTVLKGIDGGAVRIRRKDRSIDLNPYLTFCLFCQPSVVRNMGRESSFDGNGLVERFLYALPVSQLGYRCHTNEVVSEQLQSEYDNRIKRLLNDLMVPPGEESPRWTLTLASAAFDEWREFQDHIEIQLRPGGKLYPILGWGGKICGYALRLAGLLHVMEHSSRNLVISMETMGRALELATLLIDHALAAFNLMGADDDQRKTNLVYEWIIFNGKARFRKRDCLRALHGRFRGVKELEDILKALEDRHIISAPIHVGASGRPSIFFDVNPALFQEEI